MLKVNKEILNAVLQASRTYSVPVDIILSVIEQESGFNPKALSKAGAKGLMQLMPATAAGLGVVNAYDIHQNVMGGTKYLSQLLKRFKGDIRKALAGYNAGPNAVAKYNGIPPYKETKQYVKNITSRINSGKYNGITGGASNILAGDASSQSTNAISNIPTPANVTIPDPVLMGNPFQETPDTYINRATDAQNLKNLYTMATTSRPTSANMTDAEIQAYNTALTPVNAQDYINMQNAQNNAVLQLQQQLAQRDATAQQALADRYAEIEALYNQDPRLINQGYYINPADIVANRDAQTSMDLISASGGRPSIRLETPEERAQRLYEAQVANQYGVPYAQYITAEQDRIRNMINLKAAQIQQAVEQMKANGATDQEIVKALNNSEFVKQYTEDVKNLRTTAGNLYQHTMSNDPLYSNALVNQAGGIIQEGQRANVMGATGAADYQTGIDKQLVQNVPSLYATNVGAATTNYGNQLDYDIAQQNVDINRGVAPSRAFSNTMTGFANMAIGTQANPNLDLGGVIQGLPAQTRQYIVGNATPQQVQQIYGNPAPQGNATSANSLTDKFLNYANRIRRPEDAQ